MKKYECSVCHWVYDPQVGDPDNGIAPGTPFEDVPEDWTCPLCGVSKEDFDVVEEYLQDKNIEYEVIKFEDYTIHTRSEYDKQFDYEMQRGFDKARGED